LLGSSYETPNSRIFSLLRKIHLSTSLFLLLFLLAYAISAVDFAHRKWLPHPHRISEETRKLSPGITDARVLAREWRGELAKVENSPGYLKFRVTTSLGRSREIAYSIATGDTKIQTSNVGLFTTLAWLHTSQGIWAFVAILFSAGLLTLGVTGIYMWFKNRNERWIGAALLVIGAGIPLGLIISMRLD
jgi:hypothetical protein